MDSPRKVGGAATAATTSTGTPKSTPSPRKPVDTGRPSSAQGDSSSKKPPLVITTNSDDEEVKPIRAKKFADGRYGSRGGGDTIVRLPLECLSKKEIKAELKKGKLLLPAYNYLNEDDDEEGEEEEEEEEEVDDQMNTVIGPDRARFNVWKGKNYDLHVLGDFKSDFERRVKSFQRPSMEEILMDPFCRSESGLVEEPPNGKAFLVWKSSFEGWDPKKGIAEAENATAYPVLTTSSSSEDGEGESDTDSLPDPEIIEYVNEQRKKRDEGKNVTGETVYYDDEFEVLRNLHKESHSLTNYGGIPDDRWIGKANIFYPDMTDDEKNMLLAKPEVEKVMVTSKKKSLTTISTRSPRKKLPPKEKASNEKDNNSDASAGDGVASAQ